MKNLVELTYEIPALGIHHERLRCRHQRAELREPDFSVRPESSAVESRQRLEGVVLAAVRITGEVAKRAELANDGRLTCRAQGLLHVRHGRNLVAFEEALERLWAVGLGSHYGIVSPALRGRGVTIPQLWSRFSVAINGR